eukprot:Rhum_TRINITY_DN13510_c0_g1::Rhum_TRINITY_DN13510_c0_g1_i1::g.60796::m.60796
MSHTHVKGLVALCLVGACCLVATLAGTPDSREPPHVVRVLGTGEAAPHASDLRRGFRFHVYDLGPKYVDGALEALERNWGRSVCNRGAKKSNFTMLDWRHAHSLFTADIFMMRYLRRHPLHTATPEEADMFIVPAMPHLYNCAGKMNLLKTIIPDLISGSGNVTWKRYHGHDHYVFWWEWGMPQGKAEKYITKVRKSLPGVNIMSYEFLHLMKRNDHQVFSLALKPHLKSSMHGIVVPYPDFSPLRTPREAHDANRTLFAYMAGTSTIGGIRPWIKKALQKYTEDAETPCLYQEFGRSATDTKRLGVPMQYPDYFWTSKFCPHAAGDGLSSRRPTSAILSGCIPVMVCDQCLYAFENVVDYASFAVFVSEEDVMNGKLIDILKAIPEAELNRRRAAMRAIRHHFVYNDGPPQEGDALDTIVGQMAESSRLLKRYRRWFVRNEHMPLEEGKYPYYPSNKYGLPADRF